MIFTLAQQKEHRTEFIEQCRQKAWGARCHADWVSKGIDELVAQFQKMEQEDRQLDNDIKAAEMAIDVHTVDSRNKRKEKQERRNALAEQMKFVMQNAREGHKVIEGLLQSADSNLQLATHAEKWEWPEPKHEEPTA